MTIKPPTAKDFKRFPFLTKEAIEQLQPSGLICEQYGAEGASIADTGELKANQMIHKNICKMKK